MIGFKSKCENYYKEYYSDVVDYTIAVYEKFSSHNFFIFFLYGLGLSIIDTEMKKLVCSLSFSMSAASLVARVIMRFYFKKNKKHTILFSNIYLLILLVLVGMLYFYHPSQVAYTIFICTTITTAMTSMIPVHYTPIILSALFVELFLFLGQETTGDIIEIVGYILNNFLILIFAIGINSLYSNMKFSEFKKKKILQKETFHDSLTGIYNRRYVERYVDTNLVSEKYGVMILIDLDNFKAVNDELGHDKGDELLCNVSKMLVRKFRKSDCVSRIGGDEFLIIVPGIVDKDIVTEKVKKILKEFPIFVENDDKSKKIEVSLSAGVIFAKLGEKIEYDELYRRADRFMYKAKKNGKGHAVMELIDGKEEMIFLEK